MHEINHKTWKHKKHWSKQICDNDKIKKQKAVTKAYLDLFMPNFLHENSATLAQKHRNLNMRIPNLEVNDIDFEQKKFIFQRKYFIFLLKEVKRLIKYLVSDI